MSDDLWYRALRVAGARGDHLSKILRNALADYVRQHGGTAEMFSDVHDERSFEE